MQGEIEEARRLMELEYETARTSIGNFDDQRFRIKGWAITVAGALLALAVSSDHRLGVVASGAALFFAYLDVMYMSIQQRVIDRSNDLERYLEAARRGNLTFVDSYVFGIGDVFFLKGQWRRLPKMLRDRPQVVAFYMGLALATAGATTLLN